MYYMPNALCSIGKDSGRDRLCGHHPCPGSLSHFRVRPYPANGDWRTIMSFVYDAAAMSRILGLPCETDEPVPEALDGEIVLWYGGWTLQQLRFSNAGKSRMWQDQDWY